MSEYRQVGDRAAKRHSEVEFTHISVKRNFEEVCRQIREQVAAGVLAPGDRLPAERDLAAQFGVSRTAVREALKSLEVAGIVEIRKGVTGGSFIRHGNSSAITQAIRDLVLLDRVPRSKIMEARISVTAVALRLACEHATPEDFDRIEANIDSTEGLTQTGNLSRRGALITEFYHWIGVASHNEVIGGILEALSEMARALLIRLGPTPRDDLIPVRRKILAHMRNGDADTAIAEMSAFFERLDEDFKQREQREL